MHWSEPAYILSFRAHGEHDAVVSLLTRGQGRYAGLVKGGQSRRHKGHWQPGGFITASWRARLSEQLGNLTGEAQRDYAAALLESPLGLAALTSACTLLDSAVPERMPLPAIYDALANLLPLGPDEADLARYVWFEISVLQQLGYGLNLESCALTGEKHGLAFVSPKTGRAVTRIAAEPWAEKLLPLPRFLTETLIPDWAELKQGLELTNYFIARNVAPHLPPATSQRLERHRQRLMDLVEREGLSDSVAKRLRVV
jgi:DNA repair protein RecO (recombination protein O)